jgi:hypothetical protein
MNEAEIKLQKKLTKTKQTATVVDGRLSMIEVPMWGAELSRAASTGDWTAALAAAKKLHLHGIVEQILALAR